jgi:autotransporter-associated beta strand protein
MTKDGPSTLTLSGNNTYTGATTIILGTVVANSTTSIGNGSATNTLILKGGTLQAAGTITSPGSRVVNLLGDATIDTNGNSVTIGGTVGSVGGLTKSGLGTLTLSAATTIGGDLSIANGTLVAPTALTLNGDFLNSGAFTHSNGTITIAPNNPTKTTNVIGSSDTVFYNFTNTTSGSTLQFKAGNTYTFANNLTLTGIDGSPIALNSDTTSSQWFMTLSGSNSISYVKVQDSGCAGGSSVSASDTIYDYGNNGGCWSFVTIQYSGGGGSEASATPDALQSGGNDGGEVSGDIEVPITPDPIQTGGGGGGSGGGGGDIGYLFTNGKNFALRDPFNLNILKKYVLKIFS